MNRQIKFRGKTTANGHWVYGSLIDYGDNTFAIRNSKSQPWVQADSIGQFTGLLDRSGKEICEGDILMLGKYRNSLCVVGWNEEISAFCIRFHFESSMGLKPLGAWKDKVRDIKVIGNIHDNPELINPDPQ